MSLPITFIRLQDYTVSQPRVGPKNGGSVFFQRIGISLARLHGVRTLQIKMRIITLRNDETANTFSFNLNFRMQLENR
jgi:hypothetical protein